MKVLDIFPVSIALVLVMTLFLNSCTSAKKENDWTKENFKEMVKSYTEFSEKSERLTFENKYNRSGNLASTIYFSNGHIHSKSIFKYDENENLIEEIHYNSLGQVKSKWIYLYNEIGNKIEGKAYDSENHLVSKRTYLSDENENIIEESTFNSKGILEEKSTYQYDDKRNKTEETRYNSNGNQLEKSSYQYNDNRLKIEENHNSSNENIRLKWTYEYDVKGNWIKKISFKNGILEEIIERRYQYYK